MRPKKKKPEIPITLPTLNYPATLFHIFIFMLILLNYANLSTFLLNYANIWNFMKILMKLFDKAKNLD